MKMNEMFQLGEALRLAGERLCVPRAAERQSIKNLKTAMGYTAEVKNRS
jgi:hypothetical protein